jgi:hypothetical protein
MDITFILLVTTICFLLIVVGLYFLKTLNRIQILVFGYFLLPIVSGLYGGNIWYPIHPSKIYLLYILLTNILVFSKERTEQFLREYGVPLISFFGILIIINSLSYIFVNDSLILNITSTIHVCALLLIILFAYNAEVRCNDIDAILPKYFVFVLIPIFIVCTLEAAGRIDVEAFFAGPAYEEFKSLYWSVDRVGLRRVNGIFHWPNNLANYLSCFYLLYMWRAKTSQSFFACGITIFAFIILTITRASIVACVFISILMLIKHYARYQKYLIAAIIVFAAFLLRDIAGQVIVEMKDQYVENVGSRTYYLKNGVAIAERNFPLGEGLYSTGAFLEQLGIRNFKQKYNLSTENIKTTDSFFAAMLIEIGFVGAALLVAMFIWVYCKDRSSIVRYLLILFLLTAYSNADILSMVSTESIVFFLAVGITLYDKAVLITVACSGSQTARRVSTKDH